MNVKHDGYSKRFGMDTRHGLPNVLFQVNIDGVTYQSIGGTIARMDNWYVCLNHTHGTFTAHTESYGSALSNPARFGRIEYISVIN